MARFLLDTNHLGLVVDPRTIVSQRLYEQRAEGDIFGTCTPVLCELEVGIQQVARPDEYRRALNHLLRTVRIWPIERDTALLYGQMYLDLKRQGRVLSAVDLMVAALAKQMNATVLSTDRDFEALKGIRVSNWQTTGGI